MGLLLLACDSGGLIAGELGDFCHGACQFEWYEIEERKERGGGEGEEGGWVLLDSTTLVVGL